jgi:hypothetical protein
MGLFGRLRRRLRLLLRRNRLRLRKNNLFFIYGDSFAFDKEDRRWGTGFRGTPGDLFWGALGGEAFILIYVNPFNS